MNNFADPTVDASIGFTCESGLAEKRLAIAKILGDLLRLPANELDPHTTFLNLGADSMILVSAVRMIQEQFGIKISIRQLFEECTTVDAVARYIDKASGSVTSNDVPREAQPVVVSAPAKPVMPKPKTLPTVKITDTCDPPERRQLIDQQQAYLADFTRRYNQMTKNSWQRRLQSDHLCSNRRSSAGFRFETKELCYPIVARSSSGARFSDIDDNEFIDLAMGFGANLFGHNVPFIKEALHARIDTGIQIGPDADQAADVGKMICLATGMDRILFNNSGTEAVMTALRIARAATGRAKVAVFANAYHGHFDGTLVTSEQIEGISITVPMALGTPKGMVEDILILPWNEARAFDLVREHAAELAAVLVEPVQNRRPDIHPRAFLQELRQITAAADIPLIFDEVLVGFRIHSGGAQKWFDIQADLATYGKIVGGGLPIGVVAGRAALMDRVDGGSWAFGDNSYPRVPTTYSAGTFSKHPLTLAASWAVLQEIQAHPELYEELNTRTAQLAKQLNQIFEQAAVPLRMVHFGSFFRFSANDNLSFVYQPLELDLFFYHLIANGVYVWEGRTCFLSTAHGDTEINSIVQAVIKTIEQMKSGYFWVNPAACFTSTIQVSEPAKIISGQSEQTTESQMVNYSASIERGLSLYYFGDYQASYSVDKYRLIMEGARFADANGFEAIWTPERHFHSFGGFSPNPAVISAALAQITNKVQIRGSVVLPLHHPVRVAEEWSMVDNLSGGRAGLAVALGWHCDDFVLRPDAWENRQEIIIQSIETLKKLWRGDTIDAPNGAGIATQIALHPLPCHDDLPLWLTTLGNADTYIKAGELGANILTNLIGQSTEELTEKIQIYRRTRAASGHAADTGRVTVLVHTLLGADVEHVRDQARTPFCQYLASSIGLFQKMVASNMSAADFERLSNEDRTYLLHSAYERYVNSRALIGSPESCVDMLAKLAAAGVNEIACFVDFGVEAEAVLQGFPYLAKLRRMWQSTQSHNGITKLTYRSMSPIVGRSDRDLTCNDSIRVMLPVAVATLPATGDQKMLWLISKMSQEGSLAYNSSTSLRLQGPLNVSNLRLAFEQLIKRHEALRTILNETGDTQQILNEVETDFSFRDLSLGGIKAAEDALEIMLSEQASNVFDFKQNLIRARLAKLAENLHVFNLTVHHVICDGVSVGNLLQEIEAIYSALCRGETLSLAPAMQFREFLSIREASHKAGHFDEQELYWRKQLSAELPILDLPYDRPRPQVKSFAGGRETVRLDQSSFNRLKEFSRAQDCTHFMSLLAAYTLTLHRLAQQNELAVGIAFAGRSASGSESVVGYCSTIFPIVSRIEKGLSVRQYLAQLKCSLLGAYDNQDLPFADLVQKFGRRRDISRSPFFNVAFNWDQYTLPAMHGLSVSYQSQPIVAAEYDLMPNVMEINSEIVITWDYNRDLFDATTIRRFAESFQIVLDALLKGPDTDVCLLPTMTASEYQSLTVTVNETAAPITDLSIDRCFTRQADATPEAVAIRCNGETLTFGALAHASDRVAGWLVSNISDTNTPVAIAVEPSLHMVVGVLGILKAGMAYLPIRPDWPLKRINTILADAKVLHILTDEACMQLVKSEERIVVCLDHDELWGTAICTELPHVSSENLAYVIYTAGSTGQPKGVQVTHRSIMNLLGAMQVYLEVDRGDVLLALAGLSSDMSVPDLFLPLHAGGCLVIPTTSERLDPIRLLSMMQEHRISLMQAAPAMWQAFLDAGWSGNLQLKAVVGAEASPADLAKKIASRCKMLWNMYGPTETTVWSTVKLLDQNECGEHPPSIGRPIFNTRVYVLDSQSLPVPPGIPGELYIGGAGVAQGYLGQPELSAEKFIQDPFAEQEGARMYRTGDIARWNLSGDLEFLGRADHQVKLCGFRIELGEVETALIAHPDVKEAVVVRRTDCQANARLVGYVSLAPGAQVDEIDLHNWLRETLPEYMVPSNIIILSLLPRTANGKVDRSNLPKPAQTKTTSIATPPFNSKQAALIDAWCKLLKIDKISIDDDFFMIGGDSLLLYRLQSAVKAAIDVKVPIMTFFKYPTVRGLEDWISRTPPVSVNN